MNVAILVVSTLNFALTGMLALAAMKAKADMEEELAAVKVRTNAALGQAQVGLEQLKF